MTTETTQAEIVEAVEAVLGRPAGLNIGGNTVTSCTAHLPEKQRELVRWLYGHAKENDIEASVLPKEVGLDSSTLHRVFTDTYRYPRFESKDVEKDGKKVRVKVPHPKASERVGLDGICEKIARYKKLIEQRKHLAAVGFVETSVWKRIDWLCHRSFVRQKMGFIYGESQIGKTACLQEYTRRNNSGQTTYAEVPPAGGVQFMAKKIAKALHVNCNTSFDHLLDDIVDALDASKLLIVDEVHRVFTTYQKGSVMRCLDVLRYIFDNAKCGLVICGSNVFRDRMMEGEFFQYLKQFRRRGVNEVQLPGWPPREDLRLIAQSFGLHGAHGVFEVEQARGDARPTKEKTYNSATLLEELAKEDGFGKVISRLQDAVQLASEKGEKPAWFHFCKAHDIALRMAGRVGD